jgi:hypothetical protein
MAVFFYMIGTFILTIVRWVLDQRIKNRLIDKGVSESIASQFLQPAAKKDTKTIAIKWFLILTGIGVGFTLVNLFQPYGAHSLALMAFSLAASFLGYYFFTKQSGPPSA